MFLNEFAENFNPNQKVHIVHKEELLYEGNIDTLIKLQKYRILKGSVTPIDDADNTLYVEIV